MLPTNNQIPFGLLTDESYKQDQDPFYFDSKYELGDVVERADAQNVINNLRALYAGEPPKPLSRSRVIVFSNHDGYDSYYLGVLVNGKCSRPIVKFTKQHFENNGHFMVDWKQIFAFSPVSDQVDCQSRQSSSIAPLKRVHWSAGKNINIIHCKPLKTSAFSNVQPLNIKHSVTVHRKAGNKTEYIELKQSSALIDAQSSTYLHLLLHSAALKKKKCDIPKNFQKPLFSSKVKEFKHEILKLTDNELIRTAERIYLCILDQKEDGFEADELRCLAQLCEFLCTAPRTRRCAKPSEIIHL